jgi:hypothetical protein
MLPEKPIALGRTAEIYAWEDGWVLRLFYDWFSEESVRTDLQHWLVAQVEKGLVPVG